VQLSPFTLIIGFLIPDWFADILPGEYPVHNEQGEVKSNFKSKVLSFVIFFIFSIIAIYHKLNSP